MRRVRKLPHLRKTGTARHTRAVGTFTTTVRIENHLDRTRGMDVGLMPDTGSECTWVPKRILQDLGIQREKQMVFVTADGRRLTRQVGFAIVRIGERFTTDEVVFAREGDLLLLGARTLEGLALTVDPGGKRLVDGGPTLAATPVRLRG